MAQKNSIKSLGRGKKSPESGWRFLKTHERLRTILEAQWRKSGIPLYRLAELINISQPNRIHLYFENKGRIGDRLNEFNIVALCDVLGVEIDLDIKIVR